MLLTINASSGERVRYIDSHLCAIAEILFGELFSIISTIFDPYGTTGAGGGGSPISLAINFNSLYDSLFNTIDNILIFFVLSICL